MAIAPTLLSPGDVIGGFRVEDLIGIGGMATVYRAEQISLGRPVALKVLARQLGDDDVFRERFRREGMHAASLEHPNIVPVYDSGEEEGLLYLAMRLVEGHSLADLLGEKGLTADRTIEILGPIAGALDCAHAAGLIHRDVKPSNILITSQGHPYLTDFGVAKSFAAPGLTVTGNFVGSANYAAPEQIRGLALSAASDVYALTAVLYHCLSGDVPYPAESEAGVMHAHLHEPPPTLPTLDGAESEFHTVLARGMAKDPGSRYGHAGDLMNAAALCVSRMPSPRRKAIPAFPRGGRAEAGAGGQLSPGQNGTQVVAGSVLGSLTAADRRRDPVLEEPAEAPRRRLPRPSLPRPALSRPALPRPTLSRRIALPLCAGAAVLAAVAAVVVLAGGGGDDDGGPVVRSAARGPVALNYEAPLAPAAGRGGERFDGLAFRAPVVLRGGHETLAAGMLRDGAPVPGGIPARFAAVAAEPTRARLQLGSAPAVRYAARARRGGGAALTLYLIPTVRGDLGVLCSAPAGARAGACAKAARTVRVRGVRTVPPGADPALAAKLGAALGPVRVARAGSSHLLVSSPSRRAVGVEKIAAADESAARSLGRAAAEPRDRAAVAALAVSLRHEARDLRRLAAAARARHYDAYAVAAKKSRAAGRRAGRAGRALRRMGFDSVPRLAPVRVAALRRPAPTPPVEEVVSTPVTAPEPAAEVVSAPEPAPEPAPAPSPGPAPAPPSHAIVSAPK